MFGEFTQERMMDVHKTNRVALELSLTRLSLR